MLITFKSSSSADVIMLFEYGRYMLALLGQGSCDSRGIITAEQLPTAIANLKTAITEKIPAVEEAEHEAGQTGMAAPVSLVQRAWPLLDLCERALADRAPVVWRYEKASLTRIDLPSYEALRAGAKIIEADHYGDKVLQLTDNSYFKLFRRKRLLSSALWSPYAQRFVDNCHGIRARGIPCPEIIALYRIRAIERDAVHYWPLPGETLRHIVRQHPSATEAETLRQEMGRFVARLHDLGIYFRSLHLGNIVRTPHGEFGLIDLSDLHLHRAALGRLLRKRNMKHLLRDVGEAIWLTANGTFFAAYRADQTNHGNPCGSVV